MRKLWSLIWVVLLCMTLVLTGCSKKENVKNTSNNWSDNENYNTAVNSGTEQYTKEESSEYDRKTDTTEEAPNIYGLDGAEATATEDGELSYSTDTNYNPEAAVGMPFNKSFQADGWQPVIPNTEEYAKIDESGFKDTANQPLSTFSIDVDTVSYANLRKNILNYGTLPEADAVRIEEMLNYFSYDYEEPEDGNKFTINTEIGKCPWNEEHYLLTVGIQGKNVDPEELPKSNLVFLIDVSGSMDEPDKLPLLKNAFAQLVEELGENDRISIVVYSGSSGVVLDSVRGDEQDIILKAIASLNAGGSTGGEEGIERAYKLAEKNYISNGNNRVILATDGDFNVGTSSLEGLEDLITRKKESGIYLSVMGFGSGNLKDNKMELLADKGNGNYSYIDSPREARKVLVNEMTGTLLTIAKDVKIQLEFNPSSVESYRLIGYENRALNNKDFKNDEVDAGELGAGHSVTAIYEVVPGSVRGKEEDDSDLKYQTRETEIKEKYRNEITEIRLRYKEPDAEKSKEIKKVVTFLNTPVKGRSLSEDYYFKAAVAEFGMLLRNSEYMGNTTIDTILQLAKQGLGKDPGGYRSEFINIVERCSEVYSYLW